MPRPTDADIQAHCEKNGGCSTMAAGAFLRRAWRHERLAKISASKPKTAEECHAHIVSLIDILMEDW